MPTLENEVKLKTLLVPSRSYQIEDHPEFNRLDLDHLGFHPVDLEHRIRNLEKSRTLTSDSHPSFE